MVDGLENVPSNFWTQKFFEVVKYIAVSYHGHLSYAVVANKAFWDGLPCRRAAKPRQGHGGGECLF